MSRGVQLGLQAGQLTCSVTVQTCVLYLASAAFIVHTIVDSLQSKRQSQSSQLQMQCRRTLVHKSAAADTVTGFMLSCATRLESM